MRPMNIWYLSAHDQPRGHSSRTYDYSQELVKQGHRVTMFTNSFCHWTHEEKLGPRERWRIEEVDGIRVVWLRTVHYHGNGWRRGLNMLSNVWRSLQVARILSDKPDVVIGPSVPLGTAWAASRIAKNTGAAFIFEVRDVWPLSMVENGALSRYSLVYYTFRWLEKYLYRVCQRISATIPYLHDHVAESNSDPAKIVWMPNGVNINRFKGYDRYDGGRKLPLVAMYIGGFGQPHDVITIVRAAKILQDKGSHDFRFIMVGNGMKRPECEREASQFHLANIQFRDSIPKAEIPILQTEADILIACATNSTIYRFGLNSNKIYDYFASSRPIIFSGYVANDPVAETGAGFSIPPEDPPAMVEALEKYLKMRPEERMEMGRRGRRWVEKEFDMSVLGNRMADLLRRAIKDKEEMSETPGTTI